MICISPLMWRNKPSSKRGGRVVTMSFLFAMWLTWMSNWSTQFTNALSPTYKATNISI